MQAEAIFLLNINDNNVYSSILWYQSYIDSVFEGLKSICRCYWLFVLEKEFQIFAIDDYFIHNLVISRLLVISNIDNCGIFDKNICLCSIYKKLFSLKN